MSLAVVYCLVFKDGDCIRTDITKSFDRVKQDYEKHKLDKTLHLFIVIKHTEIAGSTEFDYDVLDFKTIDPEFNPKSKLFPTKRDTLMHDLAVATYQ